MPLKETKSIDKDLMIRKNDIVSGKVPKASQDQTMPLEKRDKKVFEEERLPSAGAVAKDESQQKALSPAPALRALAESKKESLYLTVHVRDIKKAREDIVKFVTQLNGKITKTESLADRDVLRITLSLKQLNDLIEKLRLIGRVEEKEEALDVHEGDREISIEIVKIKH